MFKLCAHLIIIWHGCSNYSADRYQRSCQFYLLVPPPAGAVREPPELLPPELLPPELVLAGVPVDAGLLVPEGVDLTEGVLLVGVAVLVLGVLRVGVAVLTPVLVVVLPDLLSGLLYVALLVGLVYVEPPDELPEELLPSAGTLLIW